MLYLTQYRDQVILLVGHIDDVAPPQMQIAGKRLAGHEFVQIDPENLLAATVNGAAADTGRPCRHLGHRRRQG